MAERTTSFDQLLVDLGFEWNDAEQVWFPPDDVLDQKVAYEAIDKLLNSDEQ